MPLFDPVTTIDDDGSPDRKEALDSRLAASCILAAMSPNTGEIREECWVAPASSSSVKGCRFRRRQVHAQRIAPPGTRARTGERKRAVFGQIRAEIVVNCITSTNAQESTPL